MTHLPCVLEHAVPGRHLDGCPIEACDGCMPAIAADGVLVCAWHEQRLRRAIAACPDIVGHLIEMKDTVGQGDGSGVRGSRTPPAPLNLAAVDAADGVHAMLVSWVLLVVEEHPSALTGPDAAGSDRRPEHKATVRGPQPGDVHIVYRDARVVGLHSTATSKATATAARWLLTHLTWALTQPWAADMVTEITEHVAAVRSRWPTEERPVWLPIPCPACQLKTLTRTVPRWPGAPIHVQCENPDCTRVWDEDSWGLLTRMITQPRARTLETT